MKQIDAPGKRPGREIVWLSEVVFFFFWFREECDSGGGERRG